VCGVAVVAHPHPLYGGTRDNKVVQTIARALLALGFVCWRPDFRGVGATDGEYDEGHGETEDLLAVVDAARAEDGADTLPLLLAGFSFGSFVQSRVARRLAESGRPAARLVFVGTAVTRGRVEPVPEDTIVIHGEKDDVVPLDLVLRWAEPQDLPVVVIPGADHFFHRRLHIIRNIIRRAW
jgi:alpha/beta superfamily hydrolase